MNNKPVIPIFVRAGLIAREKGALALYLKNTPIVMMSAYKLGLEGREVRERFRNLVKDFYNATGLKGFLVSGEIDRSGKEIPGLNIKQVVDRIAMFIFSGEEESKIKSEFDLYEYAKWCANKYEQDYFLIGNGKGTFYVYGKKYSDYELIYSGDSIKQTVEVFLSQIGKTHIFLKALRVYIHSKPKEGNDPLEYFAGRGEIW